MRKILLAASLASMIALSSGAQAEGSRNFGQIYTECGLGALIAQGIDQKSTADIVAVVTNVTWDLGTTAISSNLTSPDSCARGNAKTAAFILKSYPQLEKDLALGHGRYLDALTELVQISSGEKQVFTQSIRTKFFKRASTIDYESLSRKEKAELLYDIIYSHS